MRFFTISPEIQQRLAIAVPIVALLLSLFVVYPTWGRYTALQSTALTQRKELDALRATPIPDMGAVPPAETDLPSEPPQFLGQMRLLTDMSGCRVIGFDVGSTANQESGPVRAVRARVDLEARYPQIRDFLYRLSRAPRLYVITDCTVASDMKDGQQAVNGQPGKTPGALRATIEIERYVTPPGP
jgi:hypothetical protein